MNLEQSKDPPFSFFNNLIKNSRTFLLKLLISGVSVVWDFLQVKVDPDPIFTASKESRLSYYLNPF